MDLGGKHVVITGAASGIGRACAIRFAQEGARVVASDRDAEGARVVAAEIDGIAVPADVSSEDQVRALIATAREAGGPIDLFFSNAGVTGPLGGPEVSDKDIELAWNINVMAHLWAARTLLPDWLERGEGYLLSTASAAGLLTQVAALAYSITKHAAVALAEWLSITYGDAGIKVSCICPQAVRTPLLDRVLGDPVAAAPLKAGGVLEPSDVAAVVVDGVREERFLILPHGEVAKRMALKGSDPERWMNGMRRLVREAGTNPPAG